MRGVLGTLTIGQAPRADIIPILDAALPPDLVRHHAGILDGLSAETIAAEFAPEPGEALLTTRLLDGRAVTLGRDKVEAAAAVKLAMLEARGCTTVLMLCTGRFAALTCREAHLIEPDRILPPAVAGLMGEGLLGIIVPLSEQIDSEGGKWRPLAKPPVYAVASPYSDSALPDVAAAAADLARRGVKALLLDCMGFVERHRAAASQAAGLPVILSNSLVAKLTSEIV